MVSVRRAVFPFHGRYWHRHTCDVTKTSKVKGGTKLDMRKKCPLQITRYIKQQGYDVAKMGECQFRQSCCQNRVFIYFIDSMWSGFSQHHRGKTDENINLQGIVDGQLFGMVEVDIEVLTEWTTYFQHPFLTPYECFQEISSLFCMSDIPY